MKKAKIEKEIEVPTYWQDIQHGLMFKSTLQSYLDEWWPKLFGYHLLKLGALSSEINSNSCSIAHQFSIDVKHPDVNVVAYRDELPLIEKSIDVCLLTHQLDFTPDPHRLLREIDRVLVDDGYLLLSGFNPISGVGLKHFIPYKRKKMPYNSRLFLPHRIIDWLNLLNYEVISFERFGMTPLSAKYFKVWVDDLMLDSFPAICSQYLIVARKRTYPLNLTPVKKRWRLSTTTPNYQTKVLGRARLPE